MTTNLPLNRFWGLTKTQRRRKRAMEKAKRDHRALIYLLGNKCVWCENTWAEAPLQIDHMDGRAQANHSVENRQKRWDVRVKAYWREFYQGVRLRVLCIMCNSKDGRQRQLQDQDLPPAPF